MNTDIPSTDDWGDYESDVDIKSAHRIFFGKTNQEVQEDFYRCVIERADELKFLPLIPFKYYMVGFKYFIEAGNFMMFEAADAASCFMKLVESKLQTQPEYIMPIINQLLPTVEYVGLNQDKFEASPDIYGCFSDNLIRINGLVAIKASSHK
jgi:hypothetical protein